MTRNPLALVLVLPVLLLTALCAAAAPVAPKRPATAAKLTGAITVDGVLGEAAWQAAPNHTGFEWPLGAGTRPPIPPEIQTHFKVLYSADTLYFGVKCLEPKMSELRVDAADLHDAAMWSDDDVEIFLDPVGDRREYYQLAINSAGTQTDLYMIEGGNTGSDWSAAWQVAVHKDQDFWSLEIAIPFAAFNKRPSSMWADTWVFSMSRTRTPAPFYYSQYSPAMAYHNPPNWGTLGPILIDKSRFNLSVDNPAFTLTPSGAAFKVSPSVQIENRAATPFEGTVKLSFLDTGALGSSAPFTLGPNESKRVTLPDASVPETGKRWCLFQIESKAGYLALDRMFDRWLKYVPLSLKLSQPNYRNNLYPSQKLEMIQGTLTLGVPLEEVKGLLARVSLSSTLVPVVKTETQIDMAEIPFQLPATDLPVGTYTLRAEILKPNPGKTGLEAFTLINETETILRKLGPAPRVEVRVDDQGNFLVDGVPIFIRGWYGGTGYMTSRASNIQADLPHGTNFMMGCGVDEAYNTGLYHINDMSRSFDEAQAKFDTPISDTVKAALRAVIAASQNDRYCLGYYLSDEPECRGLSPVWLESAYQFIRQEDPYRFVWIVSRAPATYMQACDVMTPHPYMAPTITEEGQRTFGTPLQHIRNVMQEAAGANDGSKAVWCMPQTFTYGPPRNVQPSFAESRWFAFTALANGAKGMVPFIFDNYWNNYENRVALDAIYQELTFLAPAWMNRDTATALTCDNPAVDALAKFYKPAGQERGHVYIVAANQSYGPNAATFTVPQLAASKYTHVLVLRENRVIPVVDGKFTDSFAGLGVHVYTTNEVVPHFKTLDQIQTQIASSYQAPVAAGNLLADPARRWSTGDTVWPTRQDAELVDGILDTAAWLPVYTDRTQCVITLEKPVTFSRLVFHSPTIRDADFDIWENGAWKTVFSWKDNLLYQFEYKGKAITTAKFRIKPVANRTGHGSWVLPEITELGLYK